MSHPHYWTKCRTCNQEYCQRCHLRCPYCEEKR